MKQPTFRIAVLPAAVLIMSTVPVFADELVWRWDFAAPGDPAACTVKEPVRVETRVVDGATCLALTGGPDAAPLERPTGTVLDSVYFPLHSRCHYRLSCRMNVSRYELRSDSEGRPRHRSMRPPLMTLHLTGAEAGPVASLRRTIGPGDYYPSPLAWRDYETLYLGKWQEFAFDFFVTRAMDQGKIDLSLQGENLSRFEVLIDEVKLECVAAWPMPSYLNGERPRLTAGSAARRRIELCVAGWPETGGMRWPLCSGIPLPKGELVDATRTRLVDGRGQPVPTQIAAFDRWDDGSVRWLLVDAEAGSAQDRFVLEYGRDVTTAALASKLRVTESEDRIEVDTGPLQFTVKRRGFDWLDSVTYRGQQWFGSGDRLTLVTEDGVTHTAAGDSQCTVRIVRTGPRHIVLEAEGQLTPTEGSPRFAYVARVSAFEGMDLLTFTFTFINVSAADEERIRSAAVSLPLVSRTDSWNLCGVEGGGTGWLLQDRHDHFQTSTGVEGKRSSGRVVLHLDQAQLQLAVRDWWQNCAKAFEIDATGLRVDLWPARSGAPYASRQGEAKTHEIVVRFAPADAEPDAAFVCFEALPQLVASPDWNCDSGAVGRLLPAPGSPWPWFDEGFAAGIETYRQRQEEQGYYGMRDFGDWKRGSTSNEWDNNSRDMTLSLVQQYLRTGDLRYFRLARQIQLHQMDTDTLHHSPEHPEWLGATHCQARNPEHRGKQPSVTFTYVGGQLVYAALAGDERARRLSLRTADFVTSMAGRGGAGYAYCARHTGWPMATVMTAYEATWDRKYLVAAERLLSCAAAAANSRDSVGEVGWGGRRIAWGYLVEALYRFYGYTRDPRAREAIVKIIDYRVDVCWRPDWGGFIYQEPELLKGVGRPSYRGIVEFPFAYLLNPRQEYLDVFTANYPTVRYYAGPGTGNSQKHFSWATRFPPLYWRCYTEIGAPLADAGAYAVLPADMTIDVDASASRPLGGHEIARYEWDFGDGHRAGGMHARHTYSERKDYTVTLRVTSSNGAVGTDVKKVRCLPEDGNSVRNGGFEQDLGQDGPPNHWRVFVISGDGQVSLDPDTAHSGRYSLMISSPTPDFEVNLVQIDRSLISERNYELSFWAKLQDVEFHPRAGTTRAIRFWGTSEPPKMRGTACAVTEGGTSDWTRYARRFRSHADEEDINFAGIFHLRSGTVWVDDVSVHPLD